MPVFEQVGMIYEIRLMMDHFSDLNRGYAFVVFSTAAEAKECVRQLNNCEIRQGRTLGICMSVDNCRLFIGGIPKKVLRNLSNLLLLIRGASLIMIGVDLISRRHTRHMSTPLHTI